MDSAMAFDWLFDHCHSQRQAVGGETNHFLWPLCRNQSYINKSFKDLILILFEGIYFVY